MLEALKKKLGGNAEANEGVGIVTSVTESEEFKQLSTDFATLKASHDSLAADLKAATELLDETNAKLGEVTEKLTAAQVIVDEVNAAKAAAQAEAHALKMAARKAAVVAAVGEAKATAFLAATESLDDAAFEAVAAALTGTVAAEANSALFKEVGVDGQVDASKPAESQEMKILKKKYATNGAK
jgi:hypothetical protein